MPAVWLNVFRQRNNFDRRIVSPEVAGKARSFPAEYGTSRKYIFNAKTAHNRVGKWLIAPPPRPHSETTPLLTLKLHAYIFIEIIIFTPTPIFPSPTFCLLFLRLLFRSSSLSYFFYEGVAFRCRKIIQMASYKRPSVLPIKITAKLTLLKYHYIWSFKYVLKHKSNLIKIYSFDTGKMILDLWAEFCRI